MTRIKGNQVVAGMHIVAPSFDFDDEGSSNAFGPVGDRNSNDGGRVAYVPNFYYVHSLSDDTKLGIGINAPFGLATKYENDWSGKYQAIESEIVTINVNPSIAWKATPALSLGFGINIQYIEATLNNKIDFQSICGNVSPLVPCAGSSNDAHAQLEADDVSFGYNFGALYDLSDKTRIGFSYRAEIQHDLEGDADFRVPSAVSGDPVVGAGLSAAFADTSLDAAADLPASASISIHHQMDKKRAVIADITWVGWSSVPELVVEFDNPLIASKN